MITKKAISIVAGLFLTLSLSAQIFEPVNWEFTAKMVNATTYELHATANVDAGWNIYSQYTEEGGPFPTTFDFKGNKGIQLKGKPKEVGDLHEKYEEVFMVDTRFYNDKVVFIQTIDLKDKTIKTVTGTVTFMACNDELCLPPTEEEFEVVLNNQK